MVALLLSYREHDAGVESVDNASGCPQIHTSVVLDVGTGTDYRIPCGCQ